MDAPRRGRSRAPRAARPALTSGTHVRRSRPALTSGTHVRRPRPAPTHGAHARRTADAVLRERGVDVRTGLSVGDAAEYGVRLAEGSFVPARSLSWCVGVRPDPVVDRIGLKADDGRLSGQLRQRRWRWARGPRSVGRVRPR
ncbi:FAD-dependent oxidoreductase [Kribbella sp. CA-245084]|uniref:FAD-dependent oxidoreductase n=1 Tax=Kribbella sp. CA-245084 TaxID=3239940 RepID=UPI003D8C6656